MHGVQSRGTTLDMKIMGIPAARGIGQEVDCEAGLVLFCTEVISRRTESSNTVYEQPGAGPANFQLRLLYVPVQRTDGRLFLILTPNADSGGIGQDAPNRTQGTGRWARTGKSGSTCNDVREAESSTWPAEKMVGVHPLLRIQLT